MNAQVSTAQRLFVGVLFVLVVTGCRDISTDRPIGAPCEAVQDCGEGAVCARQSQGSDNRICATVDMVEAADPACSGGDCDFTLTEGDDAQEGAASGDEAPSPPATEDGGGPSHGGGMEGMEDPEEPPGGDGMQGVADCNDGDAEAGDTRCGLNGRGVFVKVCEGGEWSDSSRCDDPDACVDGTTQAGTIGCGLNGRGRVSQLCEAGAWRDGSDCDDPDVCVDSATQAGATVCGLNGRGSLWQVCEAGAWRDGSDCDDPDVCVDSATQAGATVCGVNGRGSLWQICEAGAWLDSSDCDDPDVCVGSAACGDDDCGEIDDGCGGTVFCGSCPVGNDPFDPASCNGPSLTQAQALEWIGLPDATGLYLGTAEWSEGLLIRERMCYPGTGGCTGWKEEHNRDQTKGALWHVANETGRQRLDFTFPTARLSLVFERNQVQLGIKHETMFTDGWRWSVPYPGTDTFSVRTRWYFFDEFAYPVEFTAKLTSDCLQMIANSSRRGTDGSGNDVSVEREVAILMEL